MGEEGAGVSALATAFERIRAGQSTHALVGGAYNAERPDMHILFEGYQTLAQGNWQPLWSRHNEGGGIITGSASAFLVLESRQNAETRGAGIYATITAVEGIAAHATMVDLKTGSRTWQRAPVSPMTPVC